MFQVEHGSAFLYIEKKENRHYKPFLALFIRLALNRGNEALCGQLNIVSEGGNVNADMYVKIHRITTLGIYNC